jgi:hypothetical protein
MSFSSKRRSLKAAATLSEATKPASDGNSAYGIMTSAGIPIFSVPSGFATSTFTA